MDKRYKVTTQFRDANIPNRHLETDDANGASLFIHSELGTFAGIKTCSLTDRKEKIKHVFTYSGYLFTVPVI